MQKTNINGKLGMMATIKKLDLKIKGSMLAALEKLTKNKEFLLYGLFWTLVSFGFELFHFTQSVDDELFAYQPGPLLGWAVQGRFTSGYVLGIFFNNLSVPFFPLFFSQLSMLFAYCFIFVRDEKVRGPVHYLALSLFLACPILFYGYTFSCLTPILGFGFFLGAISVYLFEKKKWYTIFVGLFVGAIAIGCYQVFFPYIVCLLIFSLIQKINTEKFGGFLCKTFSHALYAIGIYCVYAGLLKLILYLTNTVISSYITGMISFLPESFEDFTTNAQKVFEKIWNIYTGKESIYTENIHCLSILFGSCVIILLLSQIFVFWKKEKWNSIGRFCFFFFLLCSLLLMPFFFFFLNFNRGGADVRTAIPFVVLLPMLFTLAWKQTGIYCRFLLSLLAVSTILQFLYVNSKMSYICYLRDKCNQRIANDIIQKILPEARLRTKTPVPLCIIGQYRLSVNPNQFITGKQYEIIGSSVFTHDGGSNLRLIRYMQQFLNFDFTTMDPKDFAKIEEEVVKMPSYPARGSIQYKNGIAIIKFSDLTPRQLNEYKKYSSFYSQFLRSAHAGGIFLLNSNDTRIGEVIWNAEKANITAGIQVEAVFPSDNTLKIKANGRDPILLLKNLPHLQTGTFCLTMRFSSNADDDIQIFFKRKDGEGTELVLGYVYIPFKRGENIIQISFPSDILDSDFFRIDPGNGIATEIFFQELKIQTMK